MMQAHTRSGHSLLVRISALTLVAVAVLATNASAGTFNDLAAFTAATQNLTYINFDTDTLGSATTDNAQIGSTYTTWGIDFPTGNVFKANFTQPKSPPMGWLNNGADGSGNHIFDATFNVGGITAVGVHNVWYGGAPTGSLLEVFNGAALVGSVLSDQVIETVDFFGVTTDTAITRIQVTVMSGSGWGLDDLYFGQAAGGVPAVPVPGAMLLGSLGAGLVGYLRRRRTL